MPSQFENLRASELYCPRCRIAQPVRERLLLVLPHGDMMEYRCQTCGTSCGTREVRHPPQPPPMMRPRGRPATP